MERKVNGVGSNTYYVRDKSYRYTKKEIPSVGFRVCNPVIYIHTMYTHTASGGSNSEVFTNQLLTD
jgi:hypothetical protein